MSDSFSGKIAQVVCRHVYFTCLWESITYRALYSATFQVQNYTLSLKLEPTTFYINIEICRVISKITRDLY